MFDENGEMILGYEKKDIERFYNNFPVSQFFSKWEDTPDRSVTRVGLAEEDYKLCHLFAQLIKKYWTLALAEAFPDRCFEFEIADDLLDEYGVCLTFWEIEAPSDAHLSIRDSKPVD